jgi:hypothetical protein
MSMRPLNQQERNSTFLRYLLALAVSMLLFGVLFFTGSRLPQKELDILKSQNLEYRTAIDKQARMLSIMDSIEANLTLLDKAGSDVTYSETEVSNLLVQMKSNISDTSGINVIYKKIASTYQKMMQDKHLIRDMRKDSEAATGCAKDLEKANKQIMDYQMMLVSMGANVPK